MQYFGGKARISKQIAEYINQHTHTHTPSKYAEPFCGSCNVAIKVNIEDKLLNDKHPYLISMWQKLKEGWVPPKTITEDDYKLIKEFKDEYPYLTGFVGFGCSFAGKWFGGYARDGKGGNYAVRAHNSVLKKVEKLKGAVFTNKDFIELDYKDRIVYCDPPYRNTTPYYKSLLGDFPYDNFLGWVKEQSKKNIVLVSEYKYNLPEGAKIVLEIDSKTSIRDKSGKVIETTEILFTFNDL